MENQSNSNPTVALSNGNGHHNGNGNGHSKVSPAVLDYVLQTETPQTEEGWNPDQIFDLLRRKVFLIAGVAATVTAATGLVTLRQPNKYEGGFQLLVEPVTAESQQGVDPLGTTPRESGLNGSLDYDTQMKVLSSPKTVEPIIKQIQQRYPEFSYSTLLQNMSITRPEDTKLITVSYTDNDPDRVKFVLDKLSEGFLKYSQQERQTSLKQGVRFVDQQIETTRRRVDSLQRQIQAFRQRNNLVSPEALSSQVSGQVQGLEQQRLEVFKQISEMQRQFDNLSDPEGASAALAADGAYQKILDRIREVESKIAVESIRFEEDQPEINVLRQQRDSMLPLLRQEARRVLGNQMASIATNMSVLQTRQKVISDAQAYWSQEVQRLPVVARLSADLDRELKVATNSLSRFLETRENLQVQSAQKEVPWQLIAPPTRPDAPIDSKQRSLVLGAIAGLLLGVGAAAMSNRMDGTIHTLDELKKSIKLPLLGMIPVKGQSFGGGLLRSLSKRDAASSVYSGLDFTESFRTLYSSLRLLNSDQPIRSLVISSAQPGDGKTTIAANLAQAAAAMGLRVLLVDADLRNPQLANVLEMPNERGLTDIITANLNPQQAIQRFSVSTPVAVSSAGDALPPREEEDSLYVLTSGQRPPNPARLLSSRKMKRLNEFFHATFDLAIYDAPPMLNISDSTLLAAHTDGIVLVTGLGKNSRNELLQVLENLRNARISVWGMIANRVPASAIERY